MRNILLSLLFLLNVCSVFSQDEIAIKMPGVLPPSPEASAINKNGQLSVGMYSGTAQASIPLHEIKLNGFSLPITLDYAGNGTKVDEIPSRTGLGWTLNGGGVVSRIVHGAPDDQTTRLPVPGNPSSTSSGANLLFYQRITTDDDGDAPLYDAEPDEFRYNAPGLSGKFVIDNNGNPIEVPYTGNKIQVTGSPYSTITIRTLQGIIYEFGNGPVESTSSHTYVSGLHGWQTVRTAFFLKKITLPNQQSINYSYSTISITSATGASQSITRNAGGTVSCFPEHATPCASSGYGSLSNTVTLVNYNTYYLSGITAADGTSINFTYESRPDYSGDNRLTGISVSGSGIKNFSLAYLDPAYTNGVGSNPGGSFNTNKRFFLKGLYQVAVNHLEVSDTLKYTFDYDDVNNLPTRLAFSQDHFGYYNGANNGYSLPVTSDGYTWGGYNLASKSPNPAYAQKGMLVKITYPTGGSDHFEYEGNTVPLTYQVNNSTPVSVSGPGLGSSSNNVWTSSITILQNQTVNIDITASHNMYYWDAISQTPPSNDATKPVVFELKNTTTNTVIYTSTRTVNTSVTVPINLVSGNTYQVKVTVTGEAYHGRADFWYDPTSAPSMSTTNVVTGGLRVRKIISYDPVSDKATNRFFSYHYKNDTGRISSGVGTYIMGVGDYKSMYSKKTYCGGSCGGCYNLCHFETLSSNSAIPLYAHSGTIVAYRAVIESDDSLFANGGIEHQYSLPEVTTGFTVLNDGIKGLSKDSYSGIGGMEILTTVFNKNKYTLKTVKNTYKFDSLFVMVNALSARRNFYHVTTNPVSDDDFQQYDAAIYNWISKWIQHDSTVTTEYDYSGNSLVTYTVDSFGTKENTLPVRTESMASDGQKISVYMKYPNHFPSTAPYTDMTTANILTPVIERKVIKNSQQLTLVKNNYYKWFPGTGNTALVVEPQTVQTTKGSGSAETRIRYHAYDSSGNILEVSKENGSRVSYLWDYNKNYPVAEIKNGSITQDTIAYTSFESTSKGNWAFSGSPTSDNSAPTGSLVYSLGGGSLSKSVNSGKTYIVSYWLKNSSGTASVSGTAVSGYPKTHSAKNGWTLMEHRITSSSSITISGSGTIDEVRLYPVGAFMSTFTYVPGVGISSSSSSNNVLTRYEFDHFNRLLRIRDGDRNILKQNEYAFRQSFTPCSTTTANWAATGLTRCVQSGTNNNYTGVKEKEEQDINNCSATYLQKRWVTTTPSSPCAQTYCSGVGYRIPTGGSTCVAGQKIFIYQTHLGGGNWECKYYYYWSQDGYRSQDYISTNISVCEVD